MFNIIAHDQAQVFTILARKDVLQRQIGYRKSCIIVTSLVEPLNTFYVFNFWNQFLYQVVELGHTDVVSIKEFVQCAVQLANVC